MLKNQNIRFPVLEINLDKLRENTEAILSHCRDQNIMVTGVVKGCNASSPIINAMRSGGCTSFGSSRMRQLMEMAKDNGKFGNRDELMLLRLPMMSEIEDLVTHIDISLNSEKCILDEIQSVCGQKNRCHKVILMYDLGDLREGLWQSKALLDLAVYVENELSNVILWGIGTNLGCYGSIKPSVENLTELVELANQIEQEIGRRLEVISGGATTSFPLVIKKQIPERINHLRIGEGILLSRDFREYFNINIEELKTDTFKLYAEIIEIQDKPTYPVGEMFVDAFGNKPEYVNLGIRKRALLAVGKQDFGDHDKLIPDDANLQIVGSSSDHLIMDITDSCKNYAIGDLIGFELFYQAMLYLTSSKDIHKAFVI